MQSWSYLIFVLIEKACLRTSRAGVRLWGNCAEGRVLLGGEKEVAKWWSLQMASEMKPLTPSTEQRSNELLKYAVKAK